MGSNGTYQATRKDLIRSVYCVFNACKVKSSFPWSFLKTAHKKFNSYSTSRNLLFGEHPRLFFEATDEEEANREANTRQNECYCRNLRFSDVDESRWRLWRRRIVIEVHPWRRSTRRRRRDTHDSRSDTVAEGNVPAKASSNNSIIVPRALQAL